jgi:hypothetical protein
MRFSPKRTQSVAVIVTCAVAIILLVVFIGYRIRRRVASDSADALLGRANSSARRLTQRSSAFSKRELTA